MRGNFLLLMLVSTLVSGYCEYCGAVVPGGETQFSLPGHSSHSLIPVHSPRPGSNEGEEDEDGQNLIIACSVFSRMHNFASPSMFM